MTENIDEKNTEKPITHVFRYEGKIVIEPVTLDQAEEIMDLNRNGYGLDARQMGRFEKPSETII